MLSKHDDRFVCSGAPLGRTAADPGGAATEAERLRQIVLMVVERRGAPIFLEGESVKSGEPRRCARVRLKMPALVKLPDRDGRDRNERVAVQEFIVPMYRRASAASIVRGGRRADLCVSIRV